MDLGKLMKQAQQMQKDLKRIEEELEASIYEGNAQNGAVKCTVNGAGTLIALSIEEELIDKDNKEVIEDLLILAINQANAMAKQDRESRMGDVAGGMKIPGLG